MDGSKWRCRARVMAYVELVFLAIIVVFITVGLVGVVLSASGATIDNTTVLQLIFAVIIIVTTAVHIWATVKLLSATRLGTNVNQAMRNVRFYLIVSIVLLVVSFLHIGSGLIFVLIIVAWRTFCTVVGFVYMKELQRIGGLVGVGPVSAAPSAYSAAPSYNAFPTDNSAPTDNTAPT